MNNNPSFLYNISNSGRPQVLLIGNGLERGCEPTIPDPKGVTEQLSWDELVAAISVKGCAVLSEKENEKIPFPLKYSLLSVPASAPTRMGKTLIDDEEHRLQSAMNKLSQHSTWRLDELKTTTRSKYRFNLNPEINQKSNKPVREVNYRMHTGYLAHNENGSQVGLWHIHGECTVSRGVVLGHDRYGRLLSRIEKLCDSQNYSAISKKSENLSIKSWAELFLYGDIYIIGFGFDLSEFDLWWLMKRKQRERMGTGCVYFYEQPDSNSLTQKMMRAHGAELPNVGATAGDYDDFYKKAFADIAKRIRVNKISTIL